MSRRLLRRLKEPRLWGALSGSPFSVDVRSSLLEAEFNLQGLSVYSAKDDYWAQRVAATMILSASNHEDFVGVFLDEDELTKRLKVKLDSKTKGAVLDSEVKSLHFDLKDFSLSAVRHLFEYMYKQYSLGTAGGGLFVMSKPKALRFVAAEVARDVSIREKIFSKMSGEQHGTYLLKLWKESNFQIQ